MDLLTETLAFVAAIGVAAQWIGWRFHIPTIVLLVVAGMIVGPVLGLLNPGVDLGSSYHSLIALGVAVILFEGGLNLRWHELKQTASGVKRLVTLGVLFSFALGAAAAHYIGALSWPVALVFAGIAIVTGPTVILPLLRQARLRRRPASFLKWEGIVNDPVGALLAVLIYEYFVSPGASTWTHTLLELAGGLLAGVALGAGGGWLLGRAFLAGKVPEYLKGPVALAAALTVFGIGNLILDEAGLVAATVLGIVIGNMGLPSIEVVRQFKESVTIFLVAGIFVLLTADLKPETLLALNWRSILLIVTMLLVVRPLSIWLATIRADMSRQERLLIAWIAPRGIVAAAVAGILGHGLTEAGHADGEMLLPTIFALILTTVILHGFSLKWLARRLDLAAARRQGLLISGANVFSTALAQTLHNHKVPVLLTDHSWHRLRNARQAGIPVYFGELLSEHAESELELTDYRSLVAVSSNDAYNALICTQYTPEFDRQHVFQLATDPASAGDRRDSAPARGRPFISKEVRFADLERNWYRGWTFQATQLTEEFAFENLLANMPEGALPIAAISKEEGVTIFAGDRKLEIRQGQRVIWFGPSRDRKTPNNQPQAPELNPERLPGASPPDPSQ